MGMGVTVGVALLVGEALAEHALLTPCIVVIGDGRAVDMAGAGKAAVEQRVTHALLIDAGLGPQGVQRRRGLHRPAMNAGAQAQAEQYRHRPIEAEASIRAALPAPRPRRGAPRVRYRSSPCHAFPIKVARIEPPGEASCYCNFLSHEQTSVVPANNPIMC